MAIKDKDLKELWGKSGDRCAICNVKLHQQGDEENYNIGEICHIISKKKNGPRHIDDYKDYDTYDNLILLCKIHHKEIDDPANIAKYSKEELLRIKAYHEKLVDSLLNDGNVRLIENLKSDIRNLGKNDSIYGLVSKCKLILSDLFDEEDILISELLKIDFSTHLVNEGKINNSLYFKIARFDDGKKRLLEILDTAITRIMIKKKQNQ